LIEHIDRIIGIIAVFFIGADACDDKRIVFEFGDWRILIDIFERRFGTDARNNEQSQRQQKYKLHFHD
jgi:hypothetical protein